MGSRNRATAQEDGSVLVKAPVPVSVWKLVEKIGAKLKLKPLVAWQIFLQSVASKLEAGDVDWMDPMFSSVAKSAFLGNEFAADGMPPIDMDALHRSDKLKSGFVGVYANGNGFRAMGRNASGKGTTYIGQYATAELAAWARCLHYRKHGFPYGAEEDKLTDFYKFVESEKALFGLNPPPTDEELLGLLDPMSLDKFIQRVLDAGVKFGQIDGRKRTDGKVSLGLKPWLGDENEDGSDDDRATGELIDPTKLADLIPLAPGQKRRLTAEEKAKIAAAVGSAPTTLAAFDQEDRQAEPTDQREPQEDLERGR